jgi:hypothetical protein
MKHLPHTLLIAAAGLASPRLHAQYSLPRFVIAGGGGPGSAGVTYAANGSVGQPAVGTSSGGGNYSLVGGFWANAVVAQPSDLPSLGAERLAGPGVRLFWPLSASAFVLDQTPALATPATATAWTRVSLPMQTNAGRVSVTVPVPVRNTFYRLRKP